MKVVISGGSMVGLSTALALKKEGIDALVIERSKLSYKLDSAFDGRVYALALGSKMFLDEIGAWQFMAADACPINEIRISDQNSTRHLHYDHKQIGEQPLGYVVESRHVQYGLQQAALKAGIKIIEECEIRSIAAPNSSSLRGAQSATKQSISQHEKLDCRVGLRPPRNDSTSSGLTEIQLSNGETIKADLVIGADGRGSAVRQMAGVKTEYKSYNQTAIVCTVEHEGHHNFTAQERFMPAGPFAILPLNDDENGKHRSSLVWTETTERAKLLLAASSERFADELSWRFTDYLGKVQLYRGEAGERSDLATLRREAPAAHERNNKVFSYPLNLSWCHNIVGERIALVGDAAHGIHPIAGQGVNLGFRDVEELAPILGNAYRNGQDIGSDDVLKKYDHARRFDIHSMINATSGINSLFASLNPLLVESRRFGLAAVEKFPPLKKLFMKHAMGMLLKKTA